jgi:hypothetical protein
MQHSVHNLYSQKAAMNKILTLKVCFAVNTGDLSLNKMDMQKSSLMNYTAKKYIYNMEN